MKIKTANVTVLVTTIACFLLNGLFHVVLMGNYFDNAFKEFGSTVNRIKEANPAWQLATEFVWVTAMYCLLATKVTSTLKIQQAIMAGMLMNAAVSATWNFINASLFKVFPVKIILPDLAFHILVIGTMAGLLMSSIHNKLQKEKT